MKIILSAATYLFNMTKYFLLLVLLALVFSPNNGHATSIPLTADDQGHYRANGNHSSGDTWALTVGGSFQDDGRSFFVFDLSSINNTIIGATLNLFPHPGTSNPNRPTVDFEIFEVTTPHDILTSEHTDSSGIPIFDDLGNGTLYGTFTKQIDVVEPILSIDLLTSAITDINQTSSYFALGISVITNPNSIWDGANLGDPNNFATLDLFASNPVPEPSTIFLLGIGLGGLFLFQRKWMNKSSSI